MSSSLIYHTQGLREYKYLSTKYVDSKIRIYIEYKEEFTCTPFPKARYTKAIVRTVLELRPKM
jgi:hypothetical protein